MKKEYDIDFSNELDAAKTMLTMFRDQLVSFRKTTDDPAELEWEIRLYDFMLEEPIKRFSQYSGARQRTGGRLLPKRQVVKKLGWVIP